MSTFLTVNPTFTIIDWEKSEPILNQCTEGLKGHDGCLYYGFILHSDESGKKTVECREAWASAAVLKEHIEGGKGIGSVMGALVEPGVATLDQIYVTGPSSELPAALKVFEAFGAIGYETMPGSFDKIKTLSGSEILPNTHITVHPTFTIKDRAKAQPILHKCQDATKDHAGNIYYGFVKNGDKVKCREAWTDAAVLKEHIGGENEIGAVMGALVEPDVGSLDSIFVAAARDQLNNAFKVFESFGAKKYEIHSGFSRFQMH